MSKLEGLVRSIAGLPEPTRKRVSAILGAVVADSASLNLDWIYDDQKMKDIVGTSNPEFWPDCKSPFFTVQNGKNSCYTDELRTCLKAIASADGEKGKIDVGVITRQLSDFFGAPDSPYQVALAKRAEKVYPVPGPWINGAVIKMLVAVKDDISPPGSKDCNDNDGYAVSLPVYLKDPAKAVEVANLLTTNEMISRHLPVQFNILENYLNDLPKPIASAKTTFKDEFPEVSDEMTRVEEQVAAGKTLGEIVSEFGKACPLPGSFQGSVAVLLTHQDYVGAVRSNILAGGDSCSRANFIGACLAARSGVEAIPMEWIEKVEGIDDVIEAAIKIY